MVGSSEYLCSAGGRFCIHSVEFLVCVGNKICRFVLILSHMILVLLRMRLLNLLMIQYFMWCTRQDNLSIVGVFLLALRSVVGRMLDLLQ
jgi:hypothetical protein